MNVIDRSLNACLSRSVSLFQLHLSSEIDPLRVRRAHIDCDRQLVITGIKLKGHWTWVKPMASFPSLCVTRVNPQSSRITTSPLIHCASLVRSMSLLCETKHLNWCGIEFYGLPLRVLPQADLSAVLSLHCFYVVCGVKTKAFVVLFQRQGFQSAVIETERLMLQSTSAFLFGLKFQEPPEASKGPSKGSLKSVRHLTLTGWRHMHTHTYIVGFFQSQVFILLWAHGTKAVTSLLDYTNCCTRVLFQPLYFDWMSILEREVHQKTTTIIDR